MEHTHAAYSNAIHLAQDLTKIYIWAQTQVNKNNNNNNNSNKSGVTCQIFHGYSRLGLGPLNITYEVGLDFLPALFSIKTIVYWR